MNAKESFNSAAELYDEVRPSYPDEVVDWIIEKTKINTKDKLLEIAPGTGQATKKFGERKYRIHGVELGDKLAKILLSNCKDMNVTVDVSSFEDWIPETDDKYKVIYCATAFHWLDPEIKYKKTAELLQKDGYLVLMWNNAIGTENKIIEEAYRLLFEYYPDKPHSTKSKDITILREQKTIGQKNIEDSGYYKLDNYLEHKWSSKQTRDKTIKGFYSQSSYLRLNTESKKELTDKLTVLFDSLDDEVFTEFVTTVFICKVV